MAILHKMRMIYRGLPALCAGLFLLSQAVYAQDMATVPVEGPEDNSGYMPGGELISSQQLIESAVCVKQDIEDSLSASGATYEYDSLGRLIKTTLESGEVILTEYWDPTAESKKKFDIFLDAAGAWQKTIQYYEDGVTINCIYFADGNPFHDGDILYEEFDLSGRLTLRLFDNQGIIRTFYYGDTSAKYYEVYSTAAGAWQKTVQYFEDGSTVQYQWLVDIHPGVGGDTVFEEYDASGKIIFRKLDSGESIMTSYFLSNHARYREIYFDASGAWQKTIKYYDDGVTAHYKWFADNLPTADGDVTYEKYDRYGRNVIRVFDTTESITTFYDGTSTLHYWQAYSDSGGVWRRSIEYEYVGGKLEKRREWMADPDTNNPGDAIFYEYRTGADLYPESARVSVTIYDTGVTVYTEYFTGLADKYYEVFIYAGFWQRTVEYWDGSRGSGILRYEWLEDPDPGSDGDVIFYEYDEDGVRIKGICDNGAPWAP